MTDEAPDADSSGVTSLGNLDVTVAHWRVRDWGGAEYLVTRLAETLGLDSVYTLGAGKSVEENPFGDVRFVDLVPEFSYAPLRRLQSRADRVFEYALWEDVDWRAVGDPDILVTSGSTTRAVITPDDTLHVNYCHSPPRWFYDRYHDRKGSVAGTLARPLVRHLRTRDAAVDPRVDHYFANSPIIQRRIWKYYKRDAEVLYPPVDLDSYHDDGDDGFYLHLGRLDVEKGVPAVVEAFAGTSHRLVLAGGDGDVTDGTRSRINAADNIRYRGFVDEAEKRALLGRCRALVFNAVNEDFGIVPVEANASGKPVLARDEGFPALFVNDNRNGYKHDGTAAGIRNVVERIEREGFDGDPTRGTDRFGFKQFETVLRDNIARAYNRLATTGVEGDD